MSSWELSPKRKCPTSIFDNFPMMNWGAAFGRRVAPAVLTPTKYSLAMGSRQTIPLTLKWLPGGTLSDQGKLWPGGTRLAATRSGGSVGLVEGVCQAAAAASASVGDHGMVWVARSSACEQEGGRPSSSLWGPGQRVRLLRPSSPCVWGALRAAALRGRPPCGC